MKLYKIMMDDRTFALVDDALSKEVEASREDGDPCFEDSIARLESVATELSRQRMATDTPEADDQVTGDPEGLPLVAQLIHANAMQTAEAQQRVIDSLQWDLDRLQATLQLVTSGVNDLCDHDWAPGTRAIMRELYPDRDRIERRARIIRADRGIID